MADICCIEDRFPGIKFCICIPSPYLDKVLISNNTVAIKCTFSCDCYSNFPRKPEYFICKKEKGGITNGDLIKCLVDNQFDPECRHYFLDFFKIDTPGQVSSFFGS